MKRSVLALPAIALVVVAAVALTGDTAQREFKESTAVEVVQENPDFAAPMSDFEAATSELQILLEVVSNSVPVSSWTPEQPTAQLLTKETCEAPANSYWLIERRGEIAAEKEVFDSNIQNVFASTDYAVRPMADFGYTIMGQSGSQVDVYWNEPENTIDLRFYSSCFEDEGLERQE